jgi:hypothetical protein
MRYVEKEVESIRYLTLLSGRFGEEAKCHRRAQNDLDEVVRHFVDDLLDLAYIDVEELLVLEVDLMYINILKGIPIVEGADHPSIT